MTKSHFKSGIKYDQKKLRWHLLPLDAIEKIVEVYEFGAKKYDEENWKDLDKPEPRYFNALMRHIVEHQKGNKIDDETGFLHLAHAAWNVIALLYFEIKKEEFAERKEIKTEKIYEQVNKKVYY